MTKLIGINARFRLKKAGGVEKWSSSVVNLLNGNTNCEYIEFTPHKWCSRGSLGHLWEQFVLPVRARKCDLLFSPGNWGPLLCPDQLLVIHDVIPLTHPELFSKRYTVLFRLLGYLMAHRVKSVITVSDYSKSEIHRMLRVPQDRILIVGGGINTNERLLPSGQNNSFLFLGGDNLRKNLAFLLEMWPEVYAISNHTLLVIHQVASKSYKTTHLPEIPGVVYISNPSDEELRKLYSTSKAVLSPSIAEGLGLPLIEAMLQGRPFVSSKTGITLELQPKGCSVLELDSKLWLDTILQIAQSENTYNPKLVRIAETFTWQKVADHLNVIFSRKSF